MGNDCFAPRFTFSLTALLEKVAPVTPSTCAVYHVSAITLLAHHVVFGKFAFGNHCAHHTHHEHSCKHEYFLFHLVDTYLLLYVIVEKDLFLFSVQNYTIIETWTRVSGKIHYF